MLIEGTTGTFSICLDVTLGSKASSQTILCRARDAWDPGINPGHGDWELFYSSSLDRFVFRTRWGTSVYDVVCDDTGPVATATKYHTWLGFSKLEAKNKIQVNGGALFEAASNVNINRYASSTLMFHVGRRTSNSGLQNYLSAGSTVNQLFWFWNELSSIQRGEMYNDGNSRAFATL